ncbi:Translin-associated factor X-interacting protein 1 [Nowakowskiella sp. JEL0407]|nr:Translin-associated factor X-interacting protein 1 [Nowakowskiella sp. JEL0407]
MHTDAELSKVVVKSIGEIDSPKKRKGIVKTAWDKQSKGEPPGTARAAEKTTTRSRTPSSYLSVDKTRPKLLVSALQYIDSELNFMGVERTLRFDVTAVHQLGIRDDWKFIDMLSPLKTKLSVQEYQKARELNKFREEFSEEIDQLRFENEMLTTKLKNTETALENEVYQNKMLSNKIQSIEQGLTSEEFVQARERETKKRLNVLQQLHTEEMQKVTDEKKSLEKALFEAETKNLALSEKIEFLEKEVKEREAKILTELESVKENYDAMFDKFKKRERYFENEIYDKKNLELSNKRFQTQVMELCNEKEYPNWEFIRRSFPVKITDMEVLCRSKKCNDAIVLLIKEILNLRAVRSNTEHHGEPKDPVGGETGAKELQTFTGLGLSPGIPRYLRKRGKILNRHISLENCVILVKDIWEAKIQFDKSPKPKSLNPDKTINLEEFLYLYLKKRFHSQSLIADWGYNLYHALENFQTKNVNCRIFFSVLTNSRDESVYHFIEKQLEDLSAAVYKCESEMHTESVDDIANEENDVVSEPIANGIIPKSVFRNILMGFWKGKAMKNEIELNQLMDVKFENFCMFESCGDEHFEQVLEIEQPGEYVTLNWIFHPDYQSAFLDVIREQELSLMERYEIELKTSMKSKSYTVFEAVKLIANIDPGKSRQELDEYLARAFAVAVNELKPRLSIEKDRFIEFAAEMVCDLDEELMESYPKLKFPWESDGEWTLWAGSGFVCYLIQWVQESLLNSEFVEVMKAEVTMRNKSVSMLLDPLPAETLRASVLMETCGADLGSEELKISILPVELLLHLENRVGMLGRTFLDTIFEGHMIEPKRIMKSLESSIRQYTINHSILSGINSNHNREKFRFPSLLRAIVLETNPFDATDGNKKSLFWLVLLVSVSVDQMLSQSQLQSFGLELAADMNVLRIIEIWRDLETNQSNPKLDKSISNSICSLLLNLLQLFLSLSLTIPRQSVSTAKNDDIPTSTSCVNAVLQICELLFSGSESQSVTKFELLNVALESITTFLRLLIHDSSLNSDSIVYILLWRHSDVSELDFPHIFDLLLNNKLIAARKRWSPNNKSLDYIVGSILTYLLNDTGYEKELDAVVGLRWFWVDYFPLLQYVFHQETLYLVEMGNRGMAEGCEVFEYSEILVYTVERITGDFGVDGDELRKAVLGPMNVGISGHFAASLASVACRLVLRDPKIASDIFHK